MKCFSFEQLTDGDTYYITYDYKMKIAEDVVELAKERGVDFETAIEEYRSEITGNDNGSYFCSKFEAGLALVGNSNVIYDAQQAGYLDGADLTDPEGIDVRLREYLLDYEKDDILKLANKQ